jgi:hypothetical protein
MPSLNDPLLLYSTNTWLAYSISNRYYGGRHWIWCSPFYRQNEIAAAAFPPSAIPGSIYDRLYEDVVSGDGHSAWIAQNRAGLMKGAECKQQEGVISEAQKEEIIAIAKDAEIANFKPLLYVIPAARVTGVVRTVPPPQRAHPMSVEYIIEALTVADFDLLDVRRVIRHV